MKKTKIIVFDLYNTLVEIKKPSKFFLTLFKASKTSFNLDISSYLNLVMTKGVEELKQILPSDFKELYAKNETLLKKELESVIVYDEVFQVLSNLQKHFRLFLISNLASPYKKPVFDTDLHLFFEQMIFSCDVGILKPNISIFKKVETITKAKPNEILMIGDSFKSDIKGAENREWNYLQINRVKKSSKKYSIRDLREVYDVFRDQRKD